MPGTRFRSLRRRLLLLAAVALAPVAFMAAIGIVLLAHQQKAGLEQAMMETVRALGTAVDNELAHSIASVETLATSRFLTAGDLRAFHEDAAVVLAVRSSWRTITLGDGAGGYLLNLLRPYGAPPPHEFAQPASIKQVIDTRQPMIGNMRVGRETKEPDFAVRVPVIRDEQMRYVLSAVIKPESMLNVLRRQVLPADGVAAVFDANMQVVARSRRQEDYVGKPASESLRRMVAGRFEGWGKDQTLEGQLVYTAFSRSRVNGWSIAVAVPRELVDYPVQRSYLVLGTGIGLSLLLGALGAMFLAGNITRPMSDLRVSAQAVGRGERPRLVETAVPEIREVSQALVSASDAREALLRSERAARAAAEAANRMKDEFLAMLGHELRNPLAAISNAVHLMAIERGPGDAALEIVRRQVGHLTRLMDDLLDVGRVMTGKIVLDRKALELATAVRQALDTLKAAGRLSRHEVELHLTPGVYVHADASRIEQIIGNLVSNALKYTPVEGRIRIDVVQENDAALIVVSDSGAGMAPELVDRIFDLFVQGPQALDRSQGGLGIGLTLVRRLVELHDGTVTAHSEGAGRGSTFTVKLPCAAPPVVPGEQTGAVAAASADHRIVLVEDNADARGTLRMLLELHGQSVHEAADGPGGVEAIERHAPGIAFIDVGLPGFDGYEVARRVRASAAGARCTLVALTGYGSPDDERRAHEAGFDLHLVKPVHPDVLLRLLARLGPSNT